MDTQSESLDSRKTIFDCPTNVGRYEKKVDVAQSEKARIGDKSKCVKFSTVVVYSFAREQGFSSVPDTGWCSLGMSQNHHAVSRFDIQHHQLLQRLRRRRQRLSQKSHTTSGTNTLAHRIRGRSRGAIKIGVNRRKPLRLSPGDSCRVPTFPSPPPLSPQTFYDPLTRAEFPHVTIFASPDVRATPPPPCLSPPSPRRVLGHLDESLAASNSFTFPEGFDTDSEASLDQVPSVNTPRTRKSGRGYSKLMPIHGAARIKLLKESGVSRLDESERDVCLRIRATRARVGCDCGPRYPCSPGRCLCIEEGVQCQVDRPSFPCSCTAASCFNPTGRTEFSQEEVRAHVQSVLNRFTNRNDEVHHHSNAEHSVVPLPCGDSDQHFVQPHSPYILTNSSIKSSPTIGVTQHSTKKVVSSPRVSRKALISNEPIISTSAHAHSPGQSSQWDNIEKETFNRISSTPNPQETSVQRVLFQDSCDTDQLKLDASVSISPLNSPEVAALYSPFSSPNMKPRSITSVSTETEFDTKSHVTPSPRIPSHIPQCFIRSKRNCRTPFPRKRKVNTAHHTSRLLSKSLNVVSDPNVIIPEDADCISLNHAGIVRLPCISTNNSPEATVSPVFTPIVSITNSNRSPVRLSWDALHEVTRLRSNHPSGVNDDSSSVVTSMEQLVADPAMEPVYTSAPCNSPAKSTTKLPVRTYASYRMKSVLFTSKSAPSSPCTPNNSSLGRLSLRHRAIPRLPVTPSHRVHRSPRTPNYRLTNNARSSPQSNAITSAPSHYHGDVDMLPSLDHAGLGKSKPLCTPVCVLQQTTCATASQGTSLLSVPTPLPPVSSSS